MDYEDFYDYDEEMKSDIEDRVEELRGNISRGDCLYCGARNGMVYEGNICFICTKCKRSVHEDTYYMWAAGYDVDLGE